MPNLVGAGGDRGARSAARVVCALAVSCIPGVAWTQPAPPPAVLTQTPELVIGAPNVPDVYERPTAQTITTIDLEHDEVKYRPNFTIGDVLRESPGVSFKQGNGPRDITISIRGSNARNGFGIRNTVLLEDGFRVTQPDGLGRTDITDPHAYGSIDVWRGPQSPLFGNYATGGAINFNLRRGRDVGGFDIGTELGSFGYWNEYVTIGDEGEQYEYTLFGSYTRGDGFITHSGFSTATENILATYSPTAVDTLTFKIVNNDLNTDLPLRLSLNQFKQNPFQRGCEGAATAAPGCATVSLFANGAFGARIAQSASEADLGRNDRRTIAGLRWAHSFDAATVGRIQAVADFRDISQPTGSTSARGLFPSGNILADLTHRSTLFGLAATHYGAVFFEYEDIDSDTLNVTPGGGLGALIANASGHHYNTGARAREEVKLSPEWTAVAGLGLEYTDINVVNTAFAFPGAVTTATPAARGFFNAAPELGLVYRPSEEWAHRARVATGYGTPQSSNLFVTPAGVPGNNSDLKSQTNVGVDIGTDWTPTPRWRLGVTGFYEWFRNELVTQSPGAGLQNFTFNAPRSEHRGVEATAEWKSVEGWRMLLAYTYDNQVFTDFTEQLSAGARTARFDRSRRNIPGVEPNELFARFGYEEPSGPLAGLGGFVEFNWHDAFFLDNANLVKAPSYGIVNLNLHWVPRLGGDVVRGVELFFNVQNLLDKTYVASANNVSDTISATTGVQSDRTVLANAGGSIFAGAPRSFFGGVRVKF
jgi:iron complex outermembrane receptor protein